MSFKGFVKSVGGFVATVFGLDSDKFKNNESVQSIGDSINEMSKTLGGKPVFQTKKEKEKAEKRAQEEMQKNIHETAENMKEINKTLKDISKMLGG